MRYLLDMMHTYVYHPDPDSGVILPLTALFRAQDTATHCKTGEKPEPCVEWVGDVQSACSAFGAVMTRRSVGEMMAGNLTLLEADLQSLLCGNSIGSEAVTTALPRALDDIYDDRSNRAVNYSFLRHSSNAVWVGRAALLIPRLIDGQERLRRGWLAGQGLDSDKAASYLSRAAVALKRLALAIYWGSGQPTRVPELMSLRWHNTAAGGRRNIFVYQGTVVTATTYNKSGYRKPTNTPMIWRRMEPRCSRAVIIWLAVVQPFLVLLEGQARGGGGGLSHGFLFSKTQTGRHDLLTSTNISECLKGSTSGTVGVGLGVQQMRHVLKAFAHRFVTMSLHPDDLASLGWGGDDDDDDDQAGGGGDIGQGEQSGLLRGVDELAGHSLSTSRNYYAIEYDDGSKFTRAMQLAKVMHSLFKLSGTKRGADAGVDADTDVDVDADATMDKGLQDERRRHTAASVRAAGAADLASIISKPATLRPHQLDVIKHIMDPGVRDIIYVAPTGSGKSVSFMLPASLGVGGMFVLVEPTRALLDDMAQRLMAANIATHVWHAAGDNLNLAARSARVLLVTPEGFCSQAFSIFIAGQHARLNIDMVIMDEAHQVLIQPAVLSKQSLSSFRPSVQRVPTIMRAICDKRLFITGTLPPSLEPTIKSAMGVDDSCKTVRGRVRSPGHSYGFVNINQKSRFESVADQLLGRLGRDDKALLLFRDKEECSETAKRFGAYTYHSSMDKKIEILSAWRANNGVMCSTSCLVQGVDIDGITLVIMHGAYSILDMVQAFGRARGIATTVLVDDGRMLRQDEALRGYVDADCRRAFLDGYMNGGTGDRCSAGDNPCDNCQLLFIGESPRAAGQAQSTMGSLTHVRQQGTRPDAMTSPNGGYGTTPFSAAPTLQASPLLTHVEEEGRTKTRPTAITPPHLVRGTTPSLAESTTNTLSSLYRPGRSGYGQGTGLSAQPTSYSVQPPNTSNSGAATSARISRCVQLVEDWLHNRFGTQDSTVAKFCVSCLMDTGPDDTDHYSVRCPRKGGQVKDMQDKIMAMVNPYKGGVGISLVCG